MCPWAREAREDGRVDVRAVLDADPDPQAMLEIVDAIAADEATEIGIMLFPQVDLGRAAWERFHSRLRNLDADRYEYGVSPMTSAAFHPEGEPNAGSGDLLKPLIRRSPDPLIQLVRVRVLDAVRGERTGGTTVLDVGDIAGLDLDAIKALSVKPKSVSQVVADSNLRTVRRMGVARVVELLDDIRRDRDETYARLGEPVRPDGAQGVDSPTAA